MKILIYTGLAALLANVAFAAGLDAESAGGVPGPAIPPEPNPVVGSIISSFVLVTTSSQPNTYGIYRDASYVYAVKGTSGTRVLYTYTPTGSLVRTIPCAGFTSGYPRDEDHTHLGSGYLCIVAGYNYNQIRIINISNGSTVQSWTPSPSGGGYSMNITWDGTYYYFNGYTNRGLFYRYTTAGAAAGTWTATGWPSSMTSCGGAGFAKAAVGQSGRYLVCDSFGAGQPACIIDMSNGSLVRTFSTWSNNGQGITVGPGVPSSYGDTAWMCWYNFTGAYKMALQVDIGGTTAIMPVSVGKVKALYR